MIVKHSVRKLAAVFGCAGFLLAAAPALAGKVHWKDDPNVPGCSALAFDDTDVWLANPDGTTFKRGICHGQRVRFKVTLAPGRDSFTVSATNFCLFKIGEDDAVTVGCRVNKAP